MSTYAYWIDPRGNIMKPDIRHIGTILAKPSLFGETDKTIKMTYYKYNEPVSSTLEGNAREEIMTRVIMRGFTRIRKTGSRNDQRWSIQVAKLNNKNRDHIWEWAKFAIQNNIAGDKYADVHIHQLQNNKMTKTSLNKIASGEQIKESLRIYTQDEAIREWEDYFDYAHLYFDVLSEQAQNELVARGYTGHLVTERIKIDSTSDSEVLTYIRQNKINYGIIEINEDNVDYFHKAIRTLGYKKIKLRVLSDDVERHFLFIPSITKKELQVLVNENEVISMFHSDSGRGRDLFMDSPLDNVKSYLTPRRYSKVTIQEQKSGHGSPLIWNDIYEDTREMIGESSLVRVWGQTQKHDSGTISAFRYARDCGEGQVYKRSENMKKNAVLKSKLLMMGYSVTSIDGTYIENYKTDREREVKENSFLVVDMKDSGNLKKDLMKLGTLFEQDAITFSKASGEYYLVSTNECPYGHPGKGKIGVELKLGKTIYGKKGEFHSKIHGRPFVFENISNRLEALIDHPPSEIRSIKHLSEESVK